MNPNDPQNPNSATPAPDLPTGTVNDPPISPIPGLDNAIAGTTIPQPSAPVTNPWDTTSPQSSTPTTQPWTQPPEQSIQVPNVNPPAATPPAPTSENTSFGAWPAGQQPNPQPLTPLPSNETPLAVAPAPTNTFVPPAEPTPTFVPPTAPTPLSPTDSEATPTIPPFLDPNASAPPASNPIPSFGQEPAPTDLSQLTGGSEQPPPEVYVPQVSSQDSLVVPPSPAGPESIKPASGSKLPKILIAVGIVVVLLVAATSAYFILGIGKSTPTAPSTSLPTATQAPLTNPPPGTQPTALPTFNPEASASASGSGSLNNLTPTPAASAGTSAIDRLKNRPKATTTP